MSGKGYNPNNTGLIDDRDLNNKGNTENKSRCDIRCRTAKSHKKECECSCEGTNHGTQVSFISTEEMSTNYCEHMFEKEDPNHKGYSMLEVDLSPHVGPRNKAFAIRYNKSKDRFEIFNFRSDKPYTDNSVHYHGNLQQVIKKASKLEEERFGYSTLDYGHSNGCPDDNTRRKTSQKSFSSAEA